MLLNTQTIIDHFYPQDTPLKALLLKHSTQVRDYALQLAHNAAGRLTLDLDIVANGAMLHDIGISHCHAPAILCCGTEPYLKHGIIGADLLREYAQINHLDLEPFIRICERHTGSGLTANDIITEKLPLPPRDFLPETLEEKLICYADKFFSKSSDGGLRPLDAVRRSLARFGTEPLARFDALHQLFAD